MSWNFLTSVAELEAVEKASFSRPQLIFKHSTRCSISVGAKYRLDDGLERLAEQYDLHFLDLLSHRDVSNHIADHFSVMHQSPQVLLIKDGQSVFDLSHFRIAPASILQADT